MKRPEPDSREARRRAQVAADWLARRDRGLTPAEQDEFLQWLAADPRHGEWTSLHRRTVGDFGALLQWRPEHSEEPNPDLLAPRRGPSRWRVVTVTLAAAAALAVAAIWWRGAPASPDERRIVTTDIERRILADGSAVELNRGAAVAAAFTATERRVTLLRGEALFSVRTDSARPFVVRAGEVDVHAVGTAFAVRLDLAAVEVLVTDGTVVVVTERDVVRSTTDGAGVGAPNVLPAGSQLVAGQRATVSRADSRPVQIVSVTAAETARLLAWQPQLLDFSSAPLEAAVREFNRRNRVQFIVADAELAAMPIVASIRSDNVEGFARFLATTPGIQVERRGELEIVLRTKR
jgi:transmembrane sensor